MKLVHIDANTEIYRNGFAESLRAFTDMVEAGTVQVGIIGYLDKDGEVNFAHFSNTAGPLNFRLVGLLETIKLKLLGALNG